MDKSNDWVLSDSISKHLYHNENFLFFPTNALIIRFQRKPFRLPLSYHSCIAKWLRVYFSETVTLKIWPKTSHFPVDIHHSIHTILQQSIYPYLVASHKGIRGSTSTSAGNSTLKER